MSRNLDDHDNAMAIIFMLVAKAGGKVSLAQTDMVSHDKILAESCDGKTITLEIRDDPVSQLIDSIDAAIGKLTEPPKDGA